MAAAAKKPIHSSCAHRVVGRAFHRMAATETAIALIIVLALILALATVSEGVREPGMAQWRLSGSWWFATLFVLLAINILAALLIRFPWNWQQAGFVTTHVGLLVLLFSMAQSFVGAIDGRLTLAEGETAGSIDLTERNERLQLGFSLKLLEFRRERNPGGVGDASFVSRIRLIDNRLSVARVAEVSMNRPLTHEGFTFYQVDFLEIPHGNDLSVLGVSRDPGRTLKYLGVTMVCVGTILTFPMRTRRRPQSSPPDRNRKSTSPNNSQDTTSGAR